MFEDISAPADWLLIAAGEGKTNPRIAQTIGNLDLIPPGRRVGGPGASYVMAPFTHFSPDHPGRFHDGSFGAFYGADSFETALFETVHHTQIFCAMTREVPGWIADKRELVGRIDATLTDIRTGFPALLDPDDYAASQAFARGVKAAGSDGIVYPSVRNPGGTCFAAFYPDVMSPPVQGRHISYHWDGARIDMIKDLDRAAVYSITP
ncbi:MAG: RES family NAD+ phosphorylase [Pararhodobacter sp.]|nr:RES family NAD+ phosphorylase [Pararhodobacter sp.]